ncbi:PTS sugar transporter [Deltaproteobacteria bacterium Smac51]|nr:PTS sugar transporter [Deltaproteobacteria bacterium Smac51]
MLKATGNFFVKLGKALMLPIAVLPIAGILLRIGQPDVLNIAFISDAGNAVFANLPVIFALGVAIGFANDNHGAAALAAFVGHAIFVAGFNALLPDGNMGVLSGIMIGAIAGGLYNKYKDISLPTYLAFFGGRRFVPIVTGLSAIALAFLFKFIWPPVGSVIASMGSWIIGSGNIGLFCYGFGNRMLIPVGLHHILNSMVWFQFGDYAIIENGAEVIKHGDLWRFFAGDPTAGSFMSPFFPVMMFGLPGGALAMVLLAKPEKRKVTAGILLSAALTGFLTGITEPLEFSFMFLAFPLYVLHALLTGVSAVVMNILDVKLGFTFSAGLFDYVLSYGMATNPLWLLPVGLAYFVLYFCIFYFAIKFWNIKTMGREDDEETMTAAEGALEPGALSAVDPGGYEPGHELYAASQYVQALGGRENIIKLGNCTTRLRLEIVRNEDVNEPVLKKLGAKGVMKNVPGSAQVVIGPEVELLADKMKRVLDAAPAAQAAPKPVPAKKAAIPSKPLIPVKVDDETAAKFVEALGGSGNIISIANCVTRLRVSVKNDSAINAPALKALGARAVLHHAPGRVQIIIGQEAEPLMGRMKILTA